MITRKKLNIYDKIFKHFISKDKGCILAITSDQLFSKVIRGAFRSAGLPTNSLFNCSQLDKAISQGKSLLVRFTQVIFLVDTTMEGKTGVIHLKSIKELMGSSCRIVVATNEVGRERIIQMYEMGADNVIIKPISVDSLIQKIAHTINPNKKIGRLVDECRAMIALDELDKAEETVQAIISIKADSPIAYILKGDIAKKKKEFDTAEQNYLQASRFNGHYLDPLKKLAELYSDTNRLEKNWNCLKNWM